MLDIDDCWILMSVGHLVRSLSNKIGTEWTKAPNLVQLLLNMYKVTSEG